MPGGAAPDGGGRRRESPLHRGAQPVKRRRTARPGDGRMGGSRAGGEGRAAGNSTSAPAGGARALPDRAQAEACDLGPGGRGPGDSPST